MIKFGSALMDAVEQIEREKAISKEIILRSLCLQKTNSRQNGNKCKSYFV